MPITGISGTGMPANWNSIKQGKTSVIQPQNNLVVQPQSNPVIQPQQPSQLPNVTKGSIFDVRA